MPAASTPMVDLFRNPSPTAAPSSSKRPVSLSRRGVAEGDVTYNQPSGPRATNVLRCPPARTTSPLALAVRGGNRAARVGALVQPAARLPLVHVQAARREQL